MSTGSTQDVRRHDPALAHKQPVAVRIVPKPEHLLEVLQVRDAPVGDLGSCVAVRRGTVSEADDRAAVAAIDRVNRRDQSASDLAATDRIGEREAELRGADRRKTVEVDPGPDQGRPPANVSQSAETACMPAVCTKFARPSKAACGWC